MSALPIIDRSKGLGASEISAALGLSPYKTRLQLYMEKTGELEPFAGNIAADVGTLLEPYVLRKFSEASGQEVIGRQDIFRHPSLPFVWATLDGRTERPAVVEAKTAGSDTRWGEAGTDEIPDEYLIQVQTQMLCAGYRLAYIPVLFGTRSFAIYNVEADRELQEMITDGAADFWGHVQRREPPEPTTLADATLRYRVSRESSVTLPDSMAATVANLVQVRGQLKALEADEEEMKLAIVSFMGENDTLVDTDGSTIATWRTAKAAMRLDGAALKSAMPDVWARFAKAAEPTRRFLLKLKED